MNTEKLPKKVVRARLLVFACIFCFIGGTFMYMQSQSDPLSRYYYGTELQRQMLAERLSNDDINILINNQVQPEQVLPYLDVEGFNINNTLYYDMAARTQKADPAFIVQFVNTYRDRFSLDSLGQVLSWMPYSNLIAYLDSGLSTPLAGNPTSFTYILPADTTLYTWGPADLAGAEPYISLRQQAANSWQQMKEAAAGDGVTLKAISGFVPYELQNKMSDYSSYPMGPYGSREEQLGLTLFLDGFDPWNQVLSKSDGLDFNGANAALSNEQRQQWEWLKTHAAQYGWVFRYPEGKEEVTGVPFQPFVLRYVTPENATAMVKHNETLEEYNAGE
ncbi:M15 family metallopeptidase [Erysipelotrichaceae bacterium RD49]|nr:M15 family metallopeptidase [Erysipelotrichaceae bacterium RD49]